MDLKFLVMISALITGLDFCSIRVCLTWTVHYNFLALRCRVNHLIYGVEFLNNRKKGQGFCLHPKPTPQCYPSNKNTRIRQNSKTNVTYLKILGQIDGHFNGEWECKHGTNRDSAIINVTVLHSDSRINKNDKQCWQSYLAFTMIGFFTAIFFCVCLLLFFICCRTYEATENDSICSCCKCILYSEIYKRAAPFIRICIVLVIVALFLIPVMKGLIEHDICKDEEMFVMIGVIMALSLLLLLAHVYMERESVIKRSIPTNQNSDPLNDDDNNEEGLETQPSDTSGTDQPFLSVEGIEETNCS